MRAEWTAALLGDVYVFVRIFGLMFICIYAIVMCRKKRSRELISTATMSADALSPTPYASLYVASFIILHPKKKE
ncbi:unnamed protein product [Toxocara canis]|uniref:ORF5a n=1 Tax=Toxocara canis TaxID=6265 RepID=A0A183UDM7_TOXCA|nr:unnamed protein product [Toxocara canis]